MFFREVRSKERIEKNYLLFIHNDKKERKIIKFAFIDGKSKKKKKNVINA